MNDRYFNAALYFNSISIIGIRDLIDGYFYWRKKIIRWALLKYCSYIQVDLILKKPFIKKKILKKPEKKKKKKEKDKDKEKEKEKKLNLVFFKR